jgi:hypothetical protein
MRSYPKCSMVVIQTYTLVMSASDDVPSNLYSIFVLQPLNTLDMSASDDVPSNLYSIFVLQPLNTLDMSASKSVNNRKTVKTVMTLTWHRHRPISSSVQGFRIVTLIFRYLMVIITTIEHFGYERI